MRNQHEYMYCKLATSREKCCLNKIQQICYSADLYGFCLKKKKSTKTPPLFPLFRLLSRNGTICSCHCKQPAAQPTLTVQLWHSTSYNEGLPVSMNSLSMLSVPAIDRKDSEERPPLPHPPLFPSYPAPQWPFDEIT